jgi:hypothetical protein
MTQVGCAADGQGDITAERDEAVARFQKETAAGASLRTSQTATSEVEALRSDLSVRTEDFSVLC